MARRKGHEEHVNHEAWAIPYGDLVTLLLAFFVVMYAISSLNEGKYRVLADALAEAFGGPPRTIRPIQLGDIQPRGSEMDRAPPMTNLGARGPVAPMPLSNWTTRPQISRSHRSGTDAAAAAIDRAALARAQAQLNAITVRVEEALSELIERRLVKVTRNHYWLEIEIKSDILFASGVAVPHTPAIDTLERLGEALQPFPNPLRIEGHTDDVPIHTLQFPSNWELSAARAASVVRIFAGRGVEPARMAVIGYGEFRPLRDNATAEGRNANRRVVVVVLATPDDVPAAGETTQMAETDLLEEAS
ncbi:flagellar motor protein MotD [Rehaibacterium terrae]|jgi:chemotaxis protein MotB|uniref:Chemotaxis protein MotB n=1 Tax=Rehaibacterium terrae TaxID=1341696 RepID=A0A7W7Y254_9GAMM|nr:flagellar motor protein MotD [Rehaibacterium terrae]MBB5016615.1 chemotaxis protein MotB [Rehaibacterium terrae]